MWFPPRTKLPCGIFVNFGVSLAKVCLPTLGKLLEISLIYTTPFSVHAESSLLCRQHRMHRTKSIALLRLRRRVHLRFLPRPTETTDLGQDRLTTLAETGHSITELPLQCIKQCTCDSQRSPKILSVTNLGYVTARIVEIAPTSHSLCYRLIFTIKTYLISIL